MFRKLLIASSFLMFRKSPIFMLAFALMVLFVAYAVQVSYQKLILAANKSLCVQVRCQPYMHDSEKAQVVADWESR